MSGAEDVSDVSDLEARLAAVEERVDELSRRLFSDLEPLRPAPVGQTEVDPDLVALASSGKEKDVAKAMLEHIKRTGADLSVAEAAVKRAAGLPD